MAKEVYVLKKLDHPSFIASLRSDSIVHFEVKDIEDYTLDILKDQIQFLFESGKGEKVPVMLTFTSYHAPNEETHNYAAKERNLKYAKIIAVVVNSLAFRLSGNFYLKFLKPQTPTKLFNSEKTAVKWLKKIEREQRKSALV